MPAAIEEEPKPSGRAALMPRAALAARLPAGASMSPAPVERAGRACGGGGRNALRSFSAASASGGADFVRYAFAASGGGASMMAGWTGECACCAGGGTKALRGTGLEMTVSERSAWCTSPLGSGGDGFGGASFFGASGGGGGRAVFARAIKLGKARSRGTSIFGNGCQMNCFWDVAFGDAAIMVWLDNSVPLGFGELPIFRAAVTSGSFLRKS